MKKIYEYFIIILIILTLYLIYIDFWILFEYMEKISIKLKSISLCDHQIEAKRASIKRERYKIDEKLRLLDAYGKNIHNFKKIFPVSPECRERLLEYDNSFWVKLRHLNHLNTVIKLALNMEYKRYMWGIRSLPGETEYLKYGLKKSVNEDIYFI